MGLFVSFVSDAHPNRREQIEARLRPARAHAVIIAAWRQLSRVAARQDGPRPSGCRNDVGPDLHRSPAHLSGLGALLGRSASSLERQNCTLNGLPNLNPKRHARSRPSALTACYWPAFAVAPIMETMV